MQKKIKVFNQLNNTNTQSTNATDYIHSLHSLQNINPVGFLFIHYMPLTELPYTEPMQDKRRKIDPKDHEQIKRDYQELHSYQKTADLWGVSKRLIIFIVNPDIWEAYRKKRIQNQVHKTYYNKEKWKHYMRKHRQNKRDAGLIVSQNKNKKA